MDIGNKIRELRKQRGITQEQLAACIGVSFQAVSKWENQIALPDITLAPVLASYFGVSMDELFAYNCDSVDAEIRSIVDEACRYRESDPSKSREILEQGLRKYPQNESLLINLLYVLNYTKNPDETIAVSHSLIERTNAASIKYDALRFLAYAYKAKGDLKSAEAAISQIPEIYFTKLTEMAFLLEGKPKYEAADKQKWVSFENLLQMMAKLAEYYEEEGRNVDAVREYEKAVDLIAVMGHSAYDSYSAYFKKKIENLQ